MRRRPPRQNASCNHLRKSSPGEVIEVVPPRPIDPLSVERRENDVVIGSEARRHRRYGQNHRDNDDQPSDPAVLEEKRTSMPVWSHGIRKDNARAPKVPEIVTEKCADLGFLHGVRVTPGACALETGPGGTRWS